MTKGSYNIVQRSMFSQKSKQNDELLISIREAVPNPDLESTDGNDVIQEFLHIRRIRKEQPHLLVFIKQIIDQIQGLITGTRISEIYVTLIYKLIM